MKLSISNIAWAAPHDEEMYRHLSGLGFDGLEIAPTRLFPENPYDRTDEVRKFADMLGETYGLSVSSMQSIWFGRSEKLFGSSEERNALSDYTEKLIDFAAAAGCRNLVFGCPKNRIIENDRQRGLAVSFFGALGRRAADSGTVLAIEPNPVIYGTNFINTTVQAFELVREINSPGVRVNVDLGTVIYNGESLSEIFANLPLVHHIHISEPNLCPVKRRDLHTQLAGLLRDSAYSGFCSIEMKNNDDIDCVKRTLSYIREVFS